MEKHRWTNEEVAEFRKKNEGFGYNNKEDTRILIPKTYGFGVTFNWGNPLTFVVIGGIVVAVLLIKIFLR